MNYLDSKLKEIDEISAYNVNGRKEIFTQQLIEQGFHDGDTFTLWSHLTELILPRLKRFKEITCSYPSNLKSEEWDNILEKMIYAFELLLKDEFIYPEDEEDKINEGLKLFGEWFRDLWW